MASYEDYDKPEADQQPIDYSNDPGDFSHSGCSDGECGEC